MSGKRESYFRGVPERLGGLGVKVYTIAVPKLASVATRAQTLAAFVRGLPEKKLNIIAHSMGGLDARYAISKLGLHALGQ